ncbi:hypothetical protein GCM10010277_82120 [Streptomyces longisporoflavus]|uniref:hypothetical protein n=1 Tax=Streptomyces longisporoflavus TaxID=28044 RepID=UPI00167D7F16|nr:hypothetical protein [Streptomyces longisporoflavus]GGV70796.1 hypothetical protein GCM10010277_82120 [Streptomyces longisporoflavus]
MRTDLVIDAVAVGSPADRRTCFYQRPSGAARSGDSSPRIIKDRGNESYRPRRPRTQFGLYSEGIGLPPDQAAAFTAVRPDQSPSTPTCSSAADWLTEADSNQGQLRGRLAERVLPLSGLR